MQSEYAVMISGSIYGTAATDNNKGVYAARSLIIVLLLPFMKQSVPIITRKTLIFGNFTRNNGTAPRLSLTVSHMNAETTVRTIA